LSAKESRRAREGQSSCPSRIARMRHAWPLVGKQTDSTIYPALVLRILTRVSAGTTSLLVNEVTDNVLSLSVHQSQVAIRWPGITWSTECAT